MCCHLTLGVGTGELWLGDEELKGLGCLGWERRHGKLLAPSLFSLPAQPGHAGSSGQRAGRVCSRALLWVYSLSSLSLQEPCCKKQGLGLRDDLHWRWGHCEAVKEWPGGGTGHPCHLGCPALPGTLISGCCCWHRAEAAEQRKVSNAWRGPGGHRNLLEADFHLHDAMQTRWFLAWKAFSWDTKSLGILWSEAFIINYCKVMKDWSFLISEKINQQHEVSSVTVPNKRLLPFAWKIRDKLLFLLCILLMRIMINICHFAA